jgi:hypothetical protein
MTEPTFSPDGKWMWNGAEWIPAPPKEDILPMESISNSQIEEVSKELGVNPNVVANVAPYFDNNRDGTLQREELEMAAFSIQSPPTAPFDQFNVGVPSIQHQPLDLQRTTIQPPPAAPFDQFNAGVPSIQPQPLDLQRKNKGKGKNTFAIIVVLLMVFGSTVFFLISPDFSPLDEFRDSDSDGIVDANDAFPQDASETDDLDNDGVGDNADDCPTLIGTSTIDRTACPDDDNDGWSNTNDVFPNDPNDWSDTDGDGYGDNNDLLINGDAYLKFKAISLQTDSGQSYDVGSSPDMFIRIKIDLNCDESYETTLDSSTKWDSHSVYSSDDLYVIYDIPEDQASICFSIQVYDDDSSEDDHLDYNTGEYSYKWFNRNLANGFSETFEEENNSSGESKSVNIEIEVSIF